MRSERSPLEQALYDIVYSATRDALRDQGPLPPQAAPEPRRSGMRRLTPEEAAAVARCRPETVRKALQLGELTGVQRVKGGRWLIRPKDLDEWLSRSS